MNLESFNALGSKLKALRRKVNEQYEKSACGGIEWSKRDVELEVVYPLLKALGFSQSDITILGDIWLIACKNKAAVVIERVPLGKEMKASSLSPWVGKFNNLGILTDGNEFQFYTDSKISGKMDATPYWSFKLTTIKDNDIKVLLSYCKEKLEVTLDNLPSIVWASHFLKEMDEGEVATFYESIAKNIEIEEPAYGQPSIEEAKKAFSILLSLLTPIPSLPPSTSNTRNLKSEGRNAFNLPRSGNNLPEHFSDISQHSKTLANIDNLTNCKVKGYQFDGGERESVRSFSEAFVDIVSILVNNYGLLTNHPDIANGWIFCRTGEEALKASWENWKKLKDNPNWKVNTCTDNSMKIRLLKNYFHLLGLPLSSLVLDIQYKTR